MKVLGIGNAIVDVICKVEDSFLSENSLAKGTMKLVDEAEFKKLLSTIKIEKTVSGGSVANSIVGLSQLGNKVGFIGKISDDELGNKYEEGLLKENVDFFYSKKKERIPTGTCLILITPDSERTMVTFLGTAGKISENDIDVNALKKSEILFLEGYLWDEGDPKKAFDKAIQNANKNFAGIIINAGALTHTSISILDALLSIKIPIIEVHLSNINGREKFRQTSYISKHALGTISGLGFNSYLAGIFCILKQLNS